MKTPIKAAVLLVACFLFLPALSSAGTITVFNNATFASHTVNAGTSNVRVGSSLVLGGPTEAVLATSVDVGVYITGSVFLDQLRLMVDGVQQGTVVSGPTTSNSFSTLFVNFAYFTDVLDVNVDVLPGSSGTIRTSILGINGVGVLSSESYFGAGPLGPVIEVRSGVVPEPGTMGLIGLALVGGALLVRRRAA